MPNDRVGRTAPHKGARVCECLCL